YAGIAVIGVTHSFWVALIAAPILVGVVGAVTEMTTLRPLYNRDPLYGLILTFGLALVFREGARQIWGGDMRRILPPFTGSTPLLGMTYPNYRLFLLAASSAILLALWLFFTRTRAGIVVRAAVQDAEMLDGLGVDVRRVFTLTFAASGGLAALAALLAALPLVPGVSRYYLLLAFDALLFGAIAMSLDLLMGYTGLVSFGHAAFYGLGAYATAILMERGVQSVWACVGFALLVVGLYALVVASHFGRVLVAIRENEDRARFLGYNVQRYKMRTTPMTMKYQSTMDETLSRRIVKKTPPMIGPTRVPRPPIMTEMMNSPDSVHSIRSGVAKAERIG